MAQNKTQHITSIGGSAVMEGVMMRGPFKLATAVRKPDGEIAVQIKDVHPLVEKLKIKRIPIIRGVFAFFDSLITSMSSLMYSAEFFDLEDEEEAEPSKFDKWLERVFGDKLKTVIIYFSLVIALAFSISLFFFLPHLIASWFGLAEGSPVVLNAVESAVRILLFLGYILLVSMEKDIKRVFQYHGAEHKTIFCYEAGLELTPENAIKMGRLHPRCGTSFLVFVMIISIFVYAVIPTDMAWGLRILWRLLLLPVVAGLSYEIIRWAGKSTNPIVCSISKPGMWLQRITTREPDESQVEVAIAAMKAVIPEDKEADKW